ncbi:MAG: glycosyl hydrolase family 28-related protein [Janthinobacterium lividum]
MNIRFTNILFTNRLCFRKMLAVVVFALGSHPVQAKPPLQLQTKLHAGSFRGATMPFTTYEAENARRSGARENVDPSVKEASSGKSYVQLGATGDSIQFNNVIAANRLILRYSIPRGSAGTLNLYLNGVFSQKIPLDSAHCYDAGKPDFFIRRYDEKAVTIHIPAGSSIKIEKEDADKCSWYGIDLIDLETAPKPLTMPANCVSIADFGASGTGTSDSRSAIVNCLRTAQKLHKGVWIPPGTYSVSSRIEIPAGVNIHGAGYWYSCLYYPNPGTTYSDAIGFKIDGSSTVSHIKFVGNGLSRAAATILFGSIGSFVTLDHCWIQNVGCVFGWCDFHHNTVKNCRIYGTYFDGIHWGDGAAYDNLAQNNYFRGLGDDAIAQVNRSDFGLAHDNVAEFNTVVASYWGRGMSDVGGDTLTLRDNIISSTYLAGVMISTEPLSPSVSRPIRGLKLLRDTIQFCGHTGHNHAGIHCWLSTNPMQDILIADCLVKNGETGGIHFDNTGYGDSAGRTVIKNTIVKQNAGSAYSNDNKKITPVLIGNTMK